MGSAVVPGPYYLPGPGYGFGLGFARAQGRRRVSRHRLGRRIQLGRRRRHLFLGDPKENMFVVFAMQSPKNRVPYRPVLRSMIYAAIEKPARAATD